MPKFDAEKKLKSWILHAIWIHVGDAGGKGAGRFWLILSDNAMTPAGVGGFWDPWKIPNRSKTALLRLDLKFWLQKWPPRESRETPRKIYEKLIEK